MAVKAWSPVARCWDVDVLLLATFAVVAAAAGAQALDSTPEPVPNTADGSVPRRNAVTVRGTFPVPYYGLAVAYDRVLARRFSVGGEFEYMLPRLGYGHLVGFSETVNGKVWMGPHAMHGVFAELSLSAAHQVLAKVPSFSKTTIAPGVSLGFRYTLAVGLSLGASGGLRWGAVVNEQPLLCTHPEFCNATREGPSGRVTIDVGWAF